ncbi:hypothetical protein BMS3Bbin04_01221 [bacterium BMS3Bbin04]|nr:hypothetical protein BMS3Bbin04_01221 [bacterium BMS3Bbin04]
MRSQALITGILILLMASYVSAGEIEKLLPSRTQISFTLDETDDVWMSRMTDDIADYQLGSGGLDDTLAVHYRADVALYINSVQMQFNSPGTVQVYVWRYSDAAEAAYPEGISPPRASASMSPLGEVLLGPITYEVQGTEEWETIISVSDIPLEGLNFYEGDGFVIGFVKTADSEARPMADDISARGTSYTWFGGPWNNGLPHTWGGYSSGEAIVEMMMRVDVSYPEGTVPAIRNLTPQCDLSKPNKAMHVTARVTDDSAIDQVALRLRKNTEDPITLMMSDPDLDDIFEVDFNLIGTFGDTFSYWIYAIDDEGNVTNGRDAAVTFDIVYVPNKSILIVDDGSVHTDIIRATYIDMEWQCAFWDVVEHNGIDEFLLDRDWGLVIINAHGSKLLPTREYGDGAFDEYLMNGGDLVYIDQDYLLANLEDESVVFSPGDFAYDVLGLETALNDPTPSESEFYGKEGDPITGIWATQTYVIGDDPAFLWADVVNPIVDGSETVLFTGEAVGMNAAYSLVNSYGGSIAFMGFDANQPIFVEELMPTSWQTLMNNLLASYELESESFSMDIVPHNTVIFGGGGRLYFDVYFENLSGDSFPGMTLWTEVTDTSGFYAGPNNVELMDITPFMTFQNMDMDKCVPGYLDRGKYQFRVSVGYYPEATVTTSFDFFKYPEFPGGDTASNGDNNWSVEGDLVTDSGLPTVAAMTQAYPNPFNPETRVSVTLPETSRLNLVLYNVRGQVVAELADGTFPAGEHQFMVDGAAMASGVYFLRAFVPGELNQTQKLILMR